MTRADLPQGPFQASGFKVGEVTADSALVWTRLSKRPARNSAVAPMFTIDVERKAGRVVTAKPSFPAGVTLENVRFGVPGTEGQTRVQYRPEGTLEWITSAWERVDPAADFTRQIRLSSLQADTRYDLRVQSASLDGVLATSELSGGFQTAPAASQPADVLFAVSTGQAFVDRDGDHGFGIYEQIAKMDPSFFVHTGDIVYYDQLAKSPDLARYHWQRTYSLPTNLRFHRNVASYFIKDDHDTLFNDCWPSMPAPQMGEMTFEKGVEIFREQVPMGSSTMRTFRWGADLQVWLVEGRDFRSANDQPDGPDKSIWGARQKAWFKRTVQESDATFRILISPTPMVGPDRKAKADNHANESFRHEGTELRDFLSRQSGMFVVCGDRHWQYHSIDPETGLHEFSCGPASDQHAGGWNRNDLRPEFHQYLNVIGGFLSVAVTRQNQEAHIEFRFHGTDGSVQHRSRHRAPR